MVEITDENIKEDLLIFLKDGDFSGLYFGGDGAVVVDIRDCISISVIEDICDFITSKYPLKFSYLWPSGSWNQIKFVHDTNRMVTKYDFKIEIRDDIYYLTAKHLRINTYKTAKIGKKPTMQKFIKKLNSYKHKEGDIWKAKPICFDGWNTIFLDEKECRELAIYLESCILSKNIEKFFNTHTKEEIDKIHKYYNNRR